MMNIILWVVFGGLAGWLASIFVGSDAAFGVLGNIIIGIAGALIGGWIADALGLGGKQGADRPTKIWPFVTAVLGAMLLIWLVNLIF